MARNRRLKLYEFVSDVVDASVEVLGAELALEPARARELSLRIARSICERNAKSTVYVPEAINLALLERNAQIWAAYQVDGPPPGCARKFTPARAIELSVQYDLSPQQVYNILAEQRALELDQVQGQLPGLET